MSKIQSIYIKNFKSIEEFEADFKGCTAILTAGNNKGKTSFLRGIPDRIRFQRPEIMLKEGSDKGKGEMSLTTGEKFVWDFDAEGKDIIKYVTSQGIKQSVTREISKRFFPATFDIDRFLQETPKEQSKQLQKIVGIDFTDIDARYKIAYDDRTEKNRDSERFHAKLVEMLEVPRATIIDIEPLQQKREQERNRLNGIYTNNTQHNAALRQKWNDEKKYIDEQVKNSNDKEKERIAELYKQNKKYNEQLRSAFDEACKAKDTDAAFFNRQQEQAKAKHESALLSLRNLQSLGYEGQEAARWVELLRMSIEPMVTNVEYPPTPEYIPEFVDGNFKEAVYPSEPEYITDVLDGSSLTLIEDEILKAQENNIRAKEYQNYVAYKQQVEDSEDLAATANEKVKEIEAEREQMIRSVKFPTGIAITMSGITIDGYPLDRNQISTSKLYIAALRIASMNLGEVRTLYFDASFLDRKSLIEIELWANENDLQLLIERPAFDGGELQYEIIETAEDKAA